MTGVQTAVVLASTEDRFAVWYVNIGNRSDVRESRLIGSWMVTSSSLRELHVWSTAAAAVWVDGRPPEPVDMLPNISLDAIRSELASEVTELQTAFEAELARRGKTSKLLPPRWPRLEELGYRSGESEDHRDRCLMAARQLAGLADAWEEIERERLARPFLVASAAEIRPLPLPRS